VVPLLLIPLLVWRLPESARYLALRGDRDGLVRVLRRMGIALTADEIRAEPAEARSPVVRLFTEGRAGGTVLLWATLFLSLLLTYLLTNWIPLVARGTGVDASGAIYGLVALNLGAIVGCVIIGRLADRSRPTVVIGLAFLLGAVAIAAIGRSAASGPLLIGTSFVAGVLAIGAQMCTVALCAGFYETSLRSTGVGWAVGVGRIGGIVGPVLGGMLIAVGTSVPDLFLVTALASVAAAAAVLLLNRYVIRESRTSEPSPAAES
jgi:AAHS family 4-hydroxybenzoate transporter-like MFS transporter